MEKEKVCDNSGGHYAKHKHNGFDLCDECFNVITDDVDAYTAKDICDEHNEHLAIEDAKFKKYDRL